MNAELSKLNAQITTWDKRLTEIKSAIEKANAIRDGGTVSQSWECGSAIAAMMSGSGFFFCTCVRLHTECWNRAR